jgi:DNA-binding NarL/FixJ family response regulator
MISTERKTRLLLVDDHGLFRESLGRLLEAESSFELSGAFASVSDAIEFMHNNQIDVVLLDFDLGEQTALDFLARLGTTNFRGSILIVTAGLNHLDRLRVLESGATGIFLKHRSPSDLIFAIRKIVSGESWLGFDPVDRSVAVDAASQPMTLTQKEKDVLAAVFEGFTNKEIGVKLGISEAYVKALLQQLFGKTGVRSRSQLVRVALEKQILRNLSSGS